MNTKLFTFSAAVFVLLVSVVSNSAQTKPKKYAFELPKDATLEETQDWLTRIITRNSSFQAKEGVVSDAINANAKSDQLSDSRITDLKFQGCQMSYKIDKALQTDRARANNPSPFPQAASHIYLKVKFDLKDINIDEITVGLTGEDSRTSVISLRTQDYKRTITLSDSETGNAKVSTATIVVDNSVAEDTKNAFVHAVNLCQAVK